MGPYRCCEPDAPCLPCLMDRLVQAEKEFARLTRRAKAYPVEGKARAHRGVRVPGGSSKGTPCCEVGHRMFEETGRSWNRKCGGRCTALSALLRACLARGVKPLQRFWNRVQRLLVRRADSWTSIPEVLPGMVMGAG